MKRIRIFSFKIFILLLAGFVWVLTPSISVQASTANGPVIDIKTPLENKHFDGPFDLHINFINHTPEQAVDMESLRVNYLKFFDIDITEKIRPFIKENSIVITQMNLPEGSHRIEIKICDFQKNESIKTFQIQVRPKTAE